MKQCVHNQAHPHHNIINHTIDYYPNMPPPNPKTWTFYGSMESYRSFVDTNQFCAAAPGVSTGLYNPDGPLTLGHARCTPVYLTNVKTTAKFSLNVEFTYSNEELNETISLEVGKVYVVTYLEDTNIKRCIGKCTDIWKVNSSETNHYYKIKFDCSVDYSNQTVIIKNDQLRGLSIYTGHEDQSTTIDNSLHRYGTTCGSIKEAVVMNATIDSNGTIIEGNIVNGKIEGFTVDGLATGKNEQKIDITTINSTTKNGSIIEGKIIYGYNSGGNVDGEVESDTGLITNATIKGTIENAIILNSQVEGGTTSGGKIIDASLDNCILYNGQITGEDMVTRGGITIGNITTGGTTVGGTGTGGVAVGTIDNKVFTIEDGVTNPISGKQLTTSGGTVVGGVIIGGEKQGNAIVNAIVKGGINTGGVTVNGITTNGTLIATSIPPYSIARQLAMDPRFNDINPVTGKANNIDKSSHDPAKLFDLVVAYNASTGQVSSNLGTATVQEVPHLIRQPILNPHDGTNW